MDPNQLALQEPADLDLQCFQLSLYLVHTVFKKFMYGYQKSI